MQTSRGNANLENAFRLMWTIFNKSIWVSLILKATKFGAAPQSFCENQNPVQDQDQTYISYIEETHQILFRSANSFKSSCIHSQNTRMYVRLDRLTDRQTEFSFACFVFQDIQNMNIHQTERIFFFSIMRLRYFLFLHAPYVMRK